MSESRFLLSQRDVHIWQLRLEDHTGTLRGSGQLISRLSSLLTADELARANRFRFEDDRRTFVAARGALRMLLGRYASIPANDIRFFYSPKGKPSLPDDHPIRFNVSHSGGMTLLAFTLQQELGVDIERIRGMNDMTGIAQSFFCPEETADLRSVPVPDRDKAFFLCWTRKEAYIKAVGDGFSTPLNSFRVALRPDEPARIFHIYHRSGEAERWKLHNIEVIHGYAAALAYTGEPRYILRHPQISAADLLNLL